MTLIMSLDFSEPESLHLPYQVCATPVTQCWGYRIQLTHRELPKCWCWRGTGEAPSGSRSAEAELQFSYIGQGEQGSYRVCYVGGLSWMQIL